MKSNVMIEGMKIKRGRCRRFNRMSACGRREARAWVEVSEMMIE